MSKLMINRGKTFPLAASKAFALGGACMLLVLGGCQGDASRTRGQGAGIGALLGAAVGTGIGAIAGGGEGAAIGAIGGAAVGGVGGLIYGDQKAKEKAEAAKAEEGLSKQIADSQARIAEAQRAKAELTASVGQLTQEESSLAAITTKTGREYEARVATYTKQVQESRAKADGAIQGVQQQLNSNGAAKLAGSGDVALLEAQERKLVEEKMELERLREQFLQMLNRQRV